MSKEMQAKLESARAGRYMEGERRIVTILFGDIVGSTAAAEQLDPEEWAEIMNGAFEHLISPISRYEGTVARLMGDAILAFFGAPIAHEDDPQRAILAALEIVQEMNAYRQKIRSRYGVAFDVRVGINTGMVVVGTVGTDLALEYTAMGDAVNMASRMEQSAAPGAVQITADTHKLVSPLFDFEDLGGIQVKGKVEPVQAYRVLSAKAEPGRLRGIEGLESPLVGRDAEMHTMRGAIIQLRQQKGQIVSVRGEAGLGKSRLIAELRKSPTPVVDARAQLLWLEGRSLSYETATPYAPFVDLFTAHFALQADQPEERKYELLYERVAAIVPQRAGEIAPYLATMLGIQLSGEALERVRYLTGPPQMRELLFRATIEYVESVTKDQPLVIVFDDLHWIDPTSLDLLEQLLHITTRAALMLVVLFRPGREALSWRFHELAQRDYSDRYTPLSLAPLDVHRSRELVANLLHIADMPVKVQALILNKAEGNPFFVEEVIRSLLDAGLVARHNGQWQATSEIVDISVPDTLAGVITARLDQLDEMAKRVAQAAAVIGRRFEYDTLVAVYEDRQNLPQALAELQRRELVYEYSRSPRLAYQFKHALTQETAHDSLLHRTSREMHRRAAEYLLQHHPDRPGEVARHFLAAGEQAKALPYLVEAGENAARAYSTPEAINIFDQALNILESEPNLALARRTYEGLGGALTLVGEVDRTIELYDAMLRDGKEAADVPMQVSALNKLAFVAAFAQGQVKQAQNYLSEAERLAKPVDDLGGLTELHTYRCAVCLMTGDFDGAMNHFEEAADMGVRAELEEPLLFGLTHSAQTLMSMTRYEEGWVKAQEAYAAAEKAGNRQYMAEVLASTYADYHIRNGDFQAARQVSEQALELAEPIGAAPAQYFAYSRLAMISRWQGEYEHAITFQQQALKAGAAFGGPGTDLLPLCEIATLYLAIGETVYHEQSAIHAQIQETIVQPTSMSSLSAAWLELGFAQLTLGNVDLAAEYFEKSLHNQDSMIYFVRPFILTGRALVALARGELEEATAEVVEGLNYVEERKMREFYPMLALTGGQVSLARGEQKRALKQFNRAEELGSRMTVRPLIWQAQAGAAKALAALGQESEAALKKQQALATIDEIAARFQDYALRDIYLQTTAKKLQVMTV
jgi:class 3 adenylate cyclase/tetratricopeptide (TPR) repeat protein